MKWKKLILFSMSSDSSFPTTLPTNTYNPITHESRVANNPNYNAQRGASPEQYHTAVESLNRADAQRNATERSSRPGRSYDSGRNGNDAKQVGGGRDRMSGNDFYTEQPGASPETYHTAVESMKQAEAYPN